MKGIKQEKHISNKQCELNSHFFSNSASFAAATLLPCPTSPSSLVLITGSTIWHVSIFYVVATSPSKDQIKACNVSDWGRSNRSAPSSILRYRRTQLQGETLASSGVVLLSHRRGSHAEWDHIVSCIESFHRLLGPSHNYKSKLSEIRDWGLLQTSNADFASIDPPGSNLSRATCPVVVSGASKCAPWGKNN